MSGEYSVAMVYLANCLLLRPNASRRGLEDNVSP